MNTNVIKIITVLVQNILLFKTISCDWKRTLEHKISRNLKPYQVAIFISNTATKKLSHQVTLKHAYPKMIFPFENSTLVNKNKFFNGIHMQKKI